MTEKEVKRRMKVVDKQFCEWFKDNYCEWPKQKKYVSDLLVLHELVDSKQELVPFWKALANADEFIGVYDWELSWKLATDMMVMRHEQY